LKSLRRCSSFCHGGIDLGDVQGWLGHKHVNTTRKFLRTRAQFTVEASKRNTGGTVRELGEANRARIKDDGSVSFESGGRRSLKTGIGVGLSLCKDNFGW
jgi:hypothetical protein